MTGLASQIDGLLDGLANWVFDNFALKRYYYCSCLPSSILQRLIAFFLFLKLAQNAKEI
jgi:hypothetical protein